MVGEKQSPEDVMLGLVPRLDSSDRAVEEAAGLAQAFLVKARAGGKRDPRSAPSWARLRALLVTRLGPAVVEAALAPPAPSSAPAGASEGVPVEEEIARRIAVVRTQRDRLEVEQLLAAAIVRGDVDARRGELALDALKELGRAIADELEERGRAELMALEVLSPEEVAWLAERRAASTPARFVPPAAPVSA